MIKLTTAALFFLAAGIFTSVSILSAYQILIVPPMIYYTYLAIKNKDLQLPKSAYWLLAFTLIALLSLIINFEIVPKPSKNFGRLKYFLFGVGGIFVLRVWINEASDKAKKIVLNTFFLSMVVAGVYAAYTFFVMGSVRAIPLTETMRYGYGSGMILLTLLSALLHRKKLPGWFDARAALLAFIFGFIGMYLTYTRGALLGFLCGLPFVLYMYQKKLGIIVGAIPVLLVTVLGTLYLFGSGNYSSRFLVNKNNNSDVIRRSQWQAAFIATKEKPALGWGLSNFHSQLFRIKNQYDLDAKEYNDAHAHNLFLEISAGTGLIGIFSFLGWVLCWAREVFTRNNLARAMIIPFGIAFIVSSQFEVTFDANNASMIMFLYALSESFLLATDSTQA